MEQQHTVQQQVTEHVSHPAFDRFVATIAALRAPDGCPWDREQTHASIAKNMIEEAYEAVTAIEEGDAEHLREELGDVLLEVVLQSQIAADEGEFSIDDVIGDVDAKMLRRHPHVFGTSVALQAAGLDPNDIETADDVLTLWDQIKAHEHKLKAQAAQKKRIAAGLPATAPAGLLDDVPKGQPALMQAQEISRKAVNVGFEWETVDDVWAQVAEEIAEFKACERGSDEATLELGDVLFTLVNVARKEGIDAETALRRACDKFRSRWSAMEEQAYSAGEQLEGKSLEELDVLWQQAKERE